MRDRENGFGFVYAVARRAACTRGPHFVERSLFAHVTLPGLAEIVDVDDVDMIEGETLLAFFNERALQSNLEAGPPPIPSG